MVETKGIRSRYEGLTQQHSVCCILPPHILHAIARNGTKEQRAKVLQTLGVDHTQRMMRSTRNLMATVKRLRSVSERGLQRTIYNAQNKESLPGELVLTEGGTSTVPGDIAVDEAYKGLEATYNFYWQVYDRNSIDGEGLPLDATVHFGTHYDNAFWDGERMIFGDGDDDLFNRFTISVDVIGHELTHGVTAHEVNLVYLNQSGALNESISDVFGSLVKQFNSQPQQTADKADWLIGAGLFTQKVKGVALRSMKSPGTAFDDPVLEKDPQPASMQDYVYTLDDNGGVHINSGIPNHAFYLVATRLGGYAWEKAGKIWYETIRDSQLRPTANFAAFAQLTIANAARLYGHNSNEQQIVNQAWKDVGVEAGVPRVSVTVP